MFKYKASYTTIMHINGKLSQASAAEWMEKATLKYISWADVCEVEFPNLKYESELDEYSEYAYYVRELAVVEHRAKRWNNKLNSVNFDKYLPM